MTVHIKPLYEERLWNNGFSLIAGVDEAGRGALAGPLVAAAVILPRDVEIKGLNDSKLLSEAEREKIYLEITSAAIAWNVVEISHAEIDAKGLQWANLTALEDAVRGLQVEPEFVLSDAFALPNLGYPRLAVIKGDRVCRAVAAASIIAKVTRDKVMVDYAKAFPEYKFEQNKGYSTPEHKALIGEFGACEIHRRCFSPVGEALRLTPD